MLRPWDCLDFMFYQPAVEQLQAVAPLKIACWKENVVSCVFGRLSMKYTGQYFTNTMMQQWMSAFSLVCWRERPWLCKPLTRTLQSQSSDIFVLSLPGLGLCAWLLLGNLACPWLWALSSQRDLIGAEPESIHTQWVPWLPAAAHVSPRTYCPCRLLWVVFPSFAVHFLSISDSSENLFYAVLVQYKPVYTMSDPLSTPGVLLFLSSG